MSFFYFTLFLIIFSYAEAVPRKSMKIQQVNAAVGGSFKWDNCGSDSDPIQLQSLVISPDPVVLGKNVSLSFKTVVTEELTGGSATLTLEKQVWGAWVEIPCVDQIGSCNYGNFCSLLPPNKCPAPFIEYDIPCACPVKPGTYSLPLVSVSTQAQNAPSWLTNGDFYIKAEFFNETSSRLGCYEVYLSIE